MPSCSIKTHAPLGVASSPPAPEGLGFPCLHGLRGVLAAWVVIYHVMPNILGQQGLGHYGYLAVDAFFAMSGFILMHTHGPDFNRLSVTRILRFYELRFWRTFPAHLAAIGVALAISIGALGYTPPFFALVRAIVLLDTWNLQAIAHEVNSPIWSLRVEWLGYFAMPFAFFLISKVRVGMVMVLSALGVILAQMTVMDAHGYPATAFQGAGALVRMAGGCTLGCLVYAVRNHHAVRYFRGDVGFGMLLAAGLMALSYSPLIAAPFLSLLTLPSAYPGPWLLRALANRPALFLGRISFSLYIVHLPVMCGFIALQRSGVISSPVASGLTIGVAVILAFAICRLVEEPARRLGRRIPSLTAIFRN